MNKSDLSVLLAALSTPSVVIGADARILTANAPAEMLFGRNGIVGRHYVTVFRQPAILEPVERAMARGEVQDAEVQLREANGDRMFQLRVSPMTFDASRAILLSFVDISDKEGASLMRRDFVANVSHELRTPLTALIGFIETLKGPARGDPAAQERFLGIMEREAGRMSRLIQDLLSLSRVEAESRIQPTERVDLASIVASASMTLGSLAKEHAVTLNVTGADEAVELPGDVDQLLQVLSNLMENAIKYGNDRVDVNLTSVERDPTLRKAAIRIEVRDNGDGIDEVHLPRLTERFYRVDSHRSREMGGTGLGLAIVKHIVNRHRGRLRIDSKLGQGTCFVITLPSE